MIWNLRGQNNCLRGTINGILVTDDFGGTKSYNNIPLVPPNSFGPPPMGAVGLDFKDRNCEI